MSEAFWHPMLSKREWFAAMAMQAIYTGVCSDRDAAVELGKLALKKGYSAHQQIAAQALGAADALIEALGKPSDYRSPDYRSGDGEGG